MVAPPPGVACYHLFTHSGIGDLSWLYSKLCNLPLPIFLDLANEAPTRPRRASGYLDQLPHVLGYRYSDEYFYEHGTWVPPSHAAAAYGRRWRDLNIQPNIRTRLEVNRWLEDGNLLQDYLPDLPTNFHYCMGDPGVSTLKADDPIVVLHFTGWSDIHDETWVASAAVLSEVANVYIMTGTYDGRSARLLPRIRNEAPKAIIATDLPWADVYHLLGRAKYCLGHASGITILANVLRVPGMCVNPRALPNLRGSWADPEFTDQLHVSTDAEFKEGVKGICAALRHNNQTAWSPLIGPVSSKLPGEEPAAVLAGYARQFKPTQHGWPADTDAISYALGRHYRSRVVLFLNPSSAANTAAFVTGVLDSGTPLAHVTLVSESDLSAVVAAVTKASWRVSRPCAIRAINNSISNVMSSRQLNAAYSAVVVDGKSVVDNLTTGLRLGWNMLSSPGAFLVSGQEDEGVQNAYAMFCKTVGLDFPPILFNWGIAERP